MIGILRACAFCLALAVSTPALAQANLTGWWRADLTVGADTTPLYFHFTTPSQGAPVLRITWSVVRWDDRPASHYTLQGSALTLTEFGLTMPVTMGADGQSFDSALPAGLVEFGATPVHFVRSDPPASLPPLAPPLGPPPTPRWTVALHAEIWGGLARDRTRSIFVADESGHVTALAQSNGAQLWQAGLGAHIRSTPVLRHGTLYVASDAALVALDARTGRQIWSAPFGHERAPRLPMSDPNTLYDEYSAGVAVDDQLAVAGSRDGCIHAVRPRTGAEIWRMCTDAIITSTPALTRDAVYFGGFDHFAYALSRVDGRVLWRVDAGRDIARDAVIAADNVLIGSRTFDVLALNLRTGARAWSRHMWYSTPDAPAVVADGRIYIGSSDAQAVFVYDQTNGRQIWKSFVPGWSWGGVALGTHTVYTGVIGGPYHGALREGAFAAFSRTDGTLRWRLDMPRPDPLIMYGFAAMPVVSGSRIFAADLSGAVYAFDDPNN